jgi:hypothetical protein
MLEALGIIPVRIGPAVAPSVRQVQVNEKITAKVHKFSNGSRTVSKGQPEYDWTLTCSAMKDKQEILDLLEASEAGGEVTISFDVGSRSYMLTNCARNSTGFSSDSDGTADLTISGVAPELLQVR